METVLDVLLVALGVVVVIRGARRGLISGAVAVAGAAGGLWLGVTLAPTMVELLSSPVRSALGTRLATLVAVGIVLALCVTVAELIGRRLSRAVAHVPGGRGLDALAGAVLGAVAWGLSVWLAAGLIVGTGVWGLSSAVGSSRVVQALDEVVPFSSSETFSAIGDALDGLGLPEVFSDGEPITDAADPPSSATDAVVDASAQVVKIVAEKPGCGVVSSGSGWALDGDSVVTNAHVVSGSSTVSVQTASGATESATVAFYDPEVDLAVLHVVDLGVDALPLAVGNAAAEDAVFAIGYPGGGSLTVTSGRVRSVLDAVGADIYGSTQVTREVYSLRAEIRAGDSGGPLVDESGEVIGVVFARSSVDSDTGYALTLGQISQDLTEGRDAVDAVSTGECTS